MVTAVSVRVITRRVRIISRLFCHKSSNSTRRLPTVTLYTKHPCSLCDDAKHQLKPFSNRFHLEEVDITDPENKHWFEKYCYDIPVFHFEGKFLMKHKVNLQDFESALTKFETLSEQLNG
ncbi:glutaredoxin-like protein C5orf63 homolog isoform X2 [Gigantopelta aegis]|nr:glutaredoxin-like protein C5orf63 homolog isoform X2 [Gigantopelta aegis]